MALCAKPTAGAETIATSAKIASHVLCISFAHSPADPCPAHLRLTVAKPNLQNRLPINGRRKPRNMTIPRAMEGWIEALQRDGRNQKLYTLCIIRAGSAASIRLTRGQRGDSVPMSSVEKMTSRPLAWALRLIANRSSGKKRPGKKLSVVACRPRSCWDVPGAATPGAQLARIRSHQSPIFISAGKLSLSLMSGVGSRAENICSA